MGWKWIRYGIMAALLTICSLDSAQGQGTVRGIVVHELTNEAVAGVVVQFTPRRLRALTDASGQFVLGDLPPGSRQLLVQRIGFQVTTVTVAVVHGDTVTVTITLRPAAMRLRDIVVSPGRFGVLDAQVVSQQTLSREDIETIPQVGEDVFRAVKRLPGMAAGDISTRLNVRGAFDQELLVMLDGVELYEPYHLKDFDGALGVVDVYAVGSVDLSTGGFSVENGDHTGGIFAMQSRIPPPDRTRTTVGLSITNVSLMNQGAFAGGRGQWLMSARRGYLDVALKLTGGDDDLSPVYWDTFGKLAYQLSDQHRVSFNTLHAFDDLNYADFDEEGALESRWWSNYGWMSWSADWSDNVTTRTTASGTRVTRSRGGWLDENNRLYGPEQAVVSDVRTLEIAGVRTDFTASFSDRVLLKLGVDAKHQRADYTYNGLTRSVGAFDGERLTARFDTVAVDIQPSGNELGAYAALRVRLVEPLTAEFGVRYDRISHADDDNLGARVLASYDMGRSTTLRASWGRYYQSHGLHQLDAGDGEDTFFPSDRADQVAMGLERRFGDVAMRVEAYRRAYADQRPRYYSLDREIDAFVEEEGDRVRVDPGVGEARGIELLIQRGLGTRWAWSASYALSEARDRIEGEWVPRTLDQRHALTLSIAHKPTSRWNLTAAFHFHSGWPITQWHYAADTLLDGTVQLRRDFGTVNAERLPAYHRIDFRVTRSFPIGGSTLQVYLDLFNLYDRRNLRSFFYRVNYNNGALFTDRLNGEELLPLLPSIGLRWEF